MRLLITAAFLSLYASQAQAAHHQHHGYSHRHVHSQVHHRGVAHAALPRGGGGGAVTVSTRGGTDNGGKPPCGPVQALIADFVADGYKPRHIGCPRMAATFRTRATTGCACDFDQGGWGKTTTFMYHAHAIIAKHGFRDGCSFGDWATSMTDSPRIPVIPGAMRIAPGATPDGYKI